MQRLHDVKAPKPVALENTVGSSAGRRSAARRGPTRGRGLAGLGARLAVDESPSWSATYGEAFPRALLAVAEEDPRVVALTAAMPGPTGLLPFQARFPERFFDVGSPSSTRSRRRPAWPWPGCAGGRRLFHLPQPGLRPGQPRRGPARLPVVFVLDRAGITGDDGPSHHGALDLALALSIPGMTVFAPSAAEEVEPMLRAALELRALDHPFPQDAGPARATPQRSGVGLAPGGCVPATGRSASSGWASWSGRAWTRRTSWRPRVSRRRCGRRVVAPPDADLLAEGPPWTGGDGGGRRAPRGRGRLHRGRRGGLDGSAGRAEPAYRVLGLPRQYLAQGKATTFWPARAGRPGCRRSVRRARLSVPAEPPR